MKTYMQDEVKYKVVDIGGNIIDSEYFADVCEAEKKAMSLTDINSKTNQAKYDKVFIICVKTYAEYTLYEDIGLSIMTKLNETAHVCGESTLGMIRPILSKYIE